MATFTRRQILSSAAGALLLSVSPLSRAAAPRFVAVRVWPAEVYTRTTIESDLQLKYRFFKLSDPDRWVIDITGVELNEILKTLPAKVLARDPYIAKIRVAQNTTDTIRLVFDLKKQVEPQVFTLEPVADFKNRLVIDFYPLAPDAQADPLESLLRDYRQGKIQSDGSTTSMSVQQTFVEDPLADIIQKLPEDKPKHVQTEEVTQPPVQRRPQKNRQIVVMLDPGHGGEDPGACGKTGLCEKDVVLSIARECRNELTRLGYLVHMTRNEDVFIPLRVRVAKARKLKADVFVSIHADAFTKPSARGTGVYALSSQGATSATAGYLARTQNESDLIGGVRTVGNSVIDNTLFDLTQTATINDSLKLGKLVLSRLGMINRLHKGHVDRAAFAVLKAPDIPSILVETAFLSNPEEESLLATPAFRKKAAQAIADGIHHYFRQGAVLAQR